MIYLIWILGGFLALSILSFVIYIFYYQEISRLEQIAEEYPGYADVRFKLGKIFMARKNYRQAQKYLQEALQIYPYFLEAYVELYHIQKAQKKKEACQNTLKRLVYYAESQNSSELLKFAKQKLSEENENT